MASRNDRASHCLPLAAGSLALLLLVSALTGGCLGTEPEELPLPTVTAVVSSTAAPTETITIPEPVNSSLISPPVVIAIPKKTVLYSDREFPQDVKAAVSDFTSGTTADTINSFLRWESVRSRTSEPEAVRIREQIRRIDYALSNTTIQDDTRLYLWVGGEQAKRIQNESRFADNGYFVATADPTVIYTRFWNSGRDRDGYLTMCVFDFRKGDHILFVNATDREFLIPHGGAWEVTSTETYRQISFTADSIPRYDDMAQTNVRFIFTQEHL